MEQAHRELIQENYIRLATAIKISIFELAGDLMGRNLITEHMRDNVTEAKNTDMRRAMALLDLLPRRGPKAMDTFYTSCVALQLFDAADILRPDKSPHGCEILPPSQPSSGKSSSSTNEESSDEEPIPDVWPPTDAPDLLRIKAIKAEDRGEKKARKYTQRYEKSITTQGQEIQYLMQNSKRALVFIINNESFSNMSDRDGSSKDAMGIKMLFTSLGCRIKTRLNLSAKEMDRACREIAEEDFTTVDSFIMFVLSHGHRGGVFGTDGDKVATGRGEQVKLKNFMLIEDMTDIFSEVPGLRGKPKLFFIQACQGTGKDSGRPVLLHPKPKEANPPSPRPTVMMESGAGGDDVSLGLTYLGNEKPDSVGEKLPSRVDIFVALAATPDSVSWRRPDFGTWFIQAILEVFARYAYKYELQRLMRRVNALLVKAETKGGYKQVMETKNTFHKEFYFFPGFPKDL